jgi:hypothetical protein
VSSIALTLGWHSRLAALAVFVLMHSFEYRDLWVFNSGDVALCIEALFLALSPCGAALSLDQSAQQRQVRVGAAAAALAGAVDAGATFANLFRVGAGQAERQRVDSGHRRCLCFATAGHGVVAGAPHWLSNSALLMNAAAWATIALGLSIAILVWNGRLRPWVLAAGVVMHTMIMITIAVGFFTPAVLVLYLAFVPPETVERLPHSAQHMAAKIMTALRQWPSKSQAGYQDSKEPQGAVAEPDADSPTGPRISADGPQ